MSSRTLQRDPEVERLLKLPRERRLRIASLLYDSVNPPPGLTEEEAEDLDRLCETFETHPENWIDWEDLEASIRRKLSSTRA